MSESGSRDAAKEWTLVTTPFEFDLTAVVQTKQGPFAVGEGGALVADTGDGWHVVFEHGPAGRDKPLQCLSVTDDGERVWFAGDSGALGCYDLSDGRKEHYNPFGDKTHTWAAIAVSGRSGEEQVLVANTSGEVLPFTIDGYEMDHGDPEKPGNGANITALTTASDAVGYAVDNSGNAYKRTFEGWDDLGIVNASVTFTDIYADPSGDVYVTATDGRLYSYDEDASAWTPIDVSNTALQAVDVFQNTIVVLDATGAVYWREFDGDARWHRQPTPTGHDLLDLELGYPDVAVGKAGTVVERRPYEKEAAQKQKKDSRKKDPKKKDPKKEKKHDPTKKKTDPKEETKKEPVECEEVVVEILGKLVLRALKSEVCEESRVAREDLLEEMIGRETAESRVVDDLDLMAVPVAEVEERERRVEREGLLEELLEARTTRERETRREPCEEERLVELVRELGC